MRIRKTSKKIPKDLQPILWSYNLDLLDLERDKNRIVINIINYGKWKQWQWLVKQYSREEIRKIIKETPITEFRSRALKLISLLLNIKHFQYASRNINT